MTEEQAVPVGSEVPQAQNVPSFNDLAKQFDPMMPQEDYDTLRSKYFSDHIIPQIKNPTAMPELWNTFKAQTERQPLLSPMQKIDLQAQLGINAAGRSLIAPMIGMTPGPHGEALKSADQQIATDDNSLMKIAAREGISTTPPRFVGSMIGMLGSAELMSQAVGPAAGFLAEQAGTSVRTIELANRALRGGLGFAAYEAASDQTGNRLMSGLKGFGIAATGELLLGLPAYLRSKGVEDAVNVAKDALAGKEVPAAAQEHVAEYVNNQAAVSQKEGNPNIFLTENAGVRGTHVLLSDPDGRPVTFDIQPGKVDKAYNSINKWLDKGGTLDTVQWHPDDASTAQSFLRDVADKRNLKYDSSIFLRTQEGKGPDTIDQLQDHGIAAEEKSGMVSVPVQHVDVPKGDLEEEGLKEATPGVPTDTDIAAEEAKANVLVKGAADDLKASGQMPKMSYQQAGLLVKRLGMDPAKADLDAIMYMGEQELNRLFEVVQTQRAAKVGADAGMTAEGFVSQETPDFRAHSNESNLPEEQSQTSYLPVSRREDYATMWKGIPRGTYYHVRPEADEGIALEGNVLTATNKIDALLKLGVSPEETFSRTGFNPGDQAVEQYGPEGILQKFQQGEVTYHTTDKADTLLYQKAQEQGYNFVDLQKEPHSEDIGYGRELLHVADRNESLQKLFPIIGGEPHPRVSEPNSLLQLLGMDPDQYQVKDIPVTGRPGMVRAVVPNSMMRRLGNGADFSGLTWSSWQDGLKRLGVKDDQIAGLNFPNSPIVMFREGVTPDTIYHEGIHTNLVNSELNPVRYISKDQRGVVTDLANGIASKGGYENMSFQGLTDEAFTYAAEAVRFNKEGLMAKLADMDTSADRVKEFVNDTARNLLGASYEKLDSPGVRIFQRRLEDLIRRTDASIFTNAQEGMRATGDMLSFEPESGTWSIPNKGQDVKFSNLNSAWDWILENNTSDYGADPSFWAQVRGARGGFTGGPPPGKNLPLPETPLTKDASGLGWTAINGWFRPFLPWVATLDRQINALGEKTGTRLPIFDAVKKVDQAVRDGDSFIQKYTEQFSGPLSQFTPAKQTSLFELLSMHPDTWEKSANKLRLEPDEIKAAGNLVKVMQDFQADTKINAMEYLQQYYPKLKYNAYQTDAVPGWGLLKNPRSQGFWENAITSGDLDPTDNHAGRFAKWLIKQGYEKKFTGTPLAELSKLVDLKATDGSYVLGATRWPLSNYVKYMKGVPDTSAQAITKALGDFQGFVEDKFTTMNKFLPDNLKLPEDLGLPRDNMNKLMLLSYAGGLALRPAIAVRDALQVLITGLPIIGPEAFAKGMSRAFTRQGWEFAENAGATLRNTNIGEAYGDIFGEAPLDSKSWSSWAVKTSQKLLGPSRWGNNLARVAVFNAGFDSASKAIEDFRVGGATSDQFLKDSHAWIMEPQTYSKFLAKAADPSVATGNLAKEMALELVDSTQWAYRRGTQPAMLKTGLGRILGQYGSWPLNYAEFLTGLGKKYSQFPEQSMKAIGTWAAVNFAASKAMEGIGADSSKWLWTSPASYTGGPQLDLVRDLMASYGSDDQAQSARARVLRYPLNFVPGSIAAKSMITAIENQEDLSPGGKGFLRMMGFKPLADVQKDQDFKDWALQESGITANPQRNRF